MHGGWCLETTLSLALQKPSWAQQTWPAVPLQPGQRWSRSAPRPVLTMVELGEAKLSWRWQACCSTFQALLGCSHVTQPCV